MIKKFIIRYFKKMKFYSGERFNFIFKNHISSLNSDLKKRDQILFDYSHLAKIFSNGEFVPLTNWSVSPSTIVHLLNDVLLNSKENIIEFGSGTSTLYIAKFLKHHHLDVRFFSIDSDLLWVEKMQSLAKSFDILDHIKFIHAPLVDVKDDWKFKNQKKWYDTEILKKELQNCSFDVVLVDGPIGSVSPFVRFSAVPFLKSSFKKNVSIFLDDTFRFEEQQIIREWQKILNMPARNYNKYSVLQGTDNFEVEPFGLNIWESS